MENSSEQQIQNPINEIPPDLKNLVEYIESPECIERLGGSGVYELAIEKGWVQKGDTVYDMGCGDGSHFGELAEAVGEDGKVYGIDIAHSLISSARKIASGLNNAEAYQMDARKIEHPLKHNAADTVIISEVLGMGNKKLAHEILKESILAAKPKGKIIVSMDSKEFFTDFAKASGMPSQVIESIEKDELEYAPRLIESKFTEKEIKESILGEKCSLDITHLSHKDIDPENILRVPRQLIDKTQKYLVLATKY